MAQITESEIKTRDLSQAPWVDQAAPYGYNWVLLPMGMKPRALICHQCAALVGIPEAHTAWHDAN
jgi:hypothetical protein